MEEREETEELLKRTVAALLSGPDVPFETHDGVETTTHTYAAMLIRLLRGDE